ncbi:MAG: MFS transporter [Cyanobacteria bacterium SW_9_44_58]|nr:MAG: MFS transporter [Cyanobacteria bacterium SW_9_44_58]
MSDLNSDSLKVKAVLLGASPIVILPSSAISPALPAIQDYFAQVDNSEYWVRLVLTMPALSIIIGGLLAGQIIDQVGRKSLLIASMLLASISGAMGYGLDSLLFLILTRVALGFAVAGAITSITTLIADYYEDKTRANLMGFQSTCIAAVGVVVLSLSGVFADISWRTPFLLYLLPLLLVPFMILWLNEPIHEVIEQDRQSHPFSWSQLPLLTIGIIYGVELLHMFLFYLTPVQLPFYLQSSFDASASLSGVAIATMTLCQGAASIGYGWMKARLTFVNILAAAFALACVGHSIVAVAPSIQFIVLGLAVSGLGFGFLFPNCKVWITQTVNPEIRGRTLGGLTTAFYIGEFLSPFASQTAVKWVGAGGTYALASGILGVVAILALASSAKSGLIPSANRFSSNS